jgi:hypothetical protein
LWVCDESKIKTPAPTLTPSSPPINKESYNSDFRLTEVDFEDVGVDQT